MEDKILADVICIHCGVKIQIKKKVSQPQCKLICPGCKHKLFVQFDTSRNPQTYSFLPLPPDREASSSTAKVPEGDGHDSDTGSTSGRATAETDDEEEDDMRRKAGKDKTVYKKRKKARDYGDRIPGEDDDDDDDRGYDDDDDDDGGGSSRSARHRTPRHGSASTNRPISEPLYLTRKKMFGLVAERYRLGNEHNIIGRQDDDEPSDISIDGDSTISRRSVSIDIVPDKYGYDYILRVLNAANPVRVNGREVRKGEKVYLSPGDTITMGRTNLKFENH